jgi:hypothetical protein
LMRMFGMLASIVTNPVRFSAFLFAALLLIHSYWAFTEGDFYGAKGVAITWFSTLGGIMIMMGLFGYGRFFHPPYLYVFLAGATVLFVKTMGWI